MNPTPDTAWFALYNDLRVLHAHNFNERTLRKHLDAYIDARIAEKAASKPSDDEMYARAVFATYRSGADKKWHTDFIERFSGPTAREVHKAWLKWLSTPCGDGWPSLPSFPELEK